MPFAGIDLGGTKLATAAFTDRGEIIDRQTMPLGGREGDAVGALIAEHAQRLSRDYDCHAVGVCVPGLYRTARGTVWAPNIPGWDDYPLQRELEAELGDTTIAIDSDRAAYILGEIWHGAARGSNDAIFLAVGTGIGAGILADGRIVRGHGDVVGAIGWLALDRPFAQRYAQHGCFEDQASGPGLVRIARDLLQQNPAYSGDLRPMKEGDLGTHEIFAAADRGDAIAVRVIDNAIELWGMAAANLVSLFNPEVIVFGGGVFGPAVKFIDRIRVEAARWAQPIAMKQARFVASELGSDAGLYGAAHLAMTANS